jgi:hypothetical protein
MDPEKIENPTVAKSVAKPNAFTKLGTMSRDKGTRFRPMAVKGKAPRTRKRARDPRYVEFY